MNIPKKRILLIDLNDPRRDTRVRILQSVGYAVRVVQNHQVAETLHEELDYDLILLSLDRDKFQQALGYSDRLQNANPGLAILLLSDATVYVPHGTLSPSMETGTPMELIQEIAQMLTGRAHVKELQPRFDSQKSKGVSA